MGLFLLQGGLRDEHWEVAVLHAEFLNLPVKEVFNGLPDGEGPGPQHVAATNIVVLNHLCFSDDLEGSSNITLKREFSKRAFRAFVYVHQDFSRREKDLAEVNGTCVDLTYLRVPVSQVLLFLGLQTQPARRKITELV